MTTLIWIFGISFGFTACWFSKEKIQEVFLGAHTLALKLEAKAAAIRAAL